MNKFILILLIGFLTACAQTRNIYEPSSEEAITIKRNVYFFDEQKQGTVTESLKETKNATVSRNVYMFERDNVEQSIEFVEEIETSKLVAENTSRKVYLFENDVEHSIKHSHKNELIAKHDLRSVYWFNEDGSISNNKEIIVDKSFIEAVEFPEVLTASNSDENELSNVFLSIDNLL